MDARKLQDLRNLGIHGDEAADEIDRLTRELAERDKQIIEIKRLCDEKYCATGADAYYHCCEMTEQWDAERLKKGLALIYGPGEGRSLCGWIDSIRQLLEDAEARAIDWISHPETIEAKRQWDAVAEALGADKDCPDSVLRAAKARAVRGQAFSLLKDLVEALDSAFISSWQSTAVWQSQLDAAREWLSARPESPPNGLPSKESSNVE